jgi:hypothetical protein
MSEQLELTLLANREWGLKQLDQALQELGAEPRVDMTPVPCLTPGCVFSTRITECKDSIGISVKVALPETARFNVSVPRFEVHAKALRLNLISLWAAATNTASEVLIDPWMQINCEWKEGPEGSEMVRSRGVWQPLENRCWKWMREKDFHEATAICVYTQANLTKQNRSLEWLEHQTHRAVEMLLSRVFSFEN